MLCPIRCGLWIFQECAGEQIIMKAMQTGPRLCQRIDGSPSKKEHGKEHYDEHDAPGKGKTFCPVRQIELAGFEVGGWMIRAVDGPTAEVWPLLLSDQYRHEVENAMSSAFIAPTKQTDNMSIM